MTAESNSGDDRLSRRISGVADSERKRQYTAALGGRNLRGDAYAARQRRRSGGYVERNHRGVDNDSRGQSVDISRVSRASLLGKALRPPLAFIPKAEGVRVLQGPLAGRRRILGCATPDVIKLDIEGGERVALEGARRILDRRHPLIFLATHGWQVHADCCALLTGFGYTMSGVGGEAPNETDELVARFGS